MVVKHRRAVEAVEAVAAAASNGVGVHNAVLLRARHIATTAAEVDVPLPLARLFLAPLLAELHLGSGHLVDRPPAPSEQCPHAPSTPPEQFLLQPPANPPQNVPGLPLFPDAPEGFLLHAPDPLGFLRAQNLRGCREQGGLHHAKSGAVFPRVLRCGQGEALLRDREWVEARRHPLGRRGCHGNGAHLHRNAGVAAAAAPALRRKAYRLRGRRRRAPADAAFLEKNRGPAHGPRSLQRGRLRQGRGVHPQGVVCRPDGERHLEGGRRETQ